MAGSITYCNALLDAEKIRMDSVINFLEQLVKSVRTIAATCSVKRQRARLFLS